MTRQEAMGKMETRVVPFELLKTPFHCEDDQALEQVVQNSDVVSICGDSQKPTGHCSGQPVPGVSA